MFGFRIVSVMLLVLVTENLGFCDSPAAAAAENTRADFEMQWQRDGWPLLQKYCLDCHNSDYSEAELDLSTFDSLDAMSSGAGSMQRVLELVRFSAMPPEDADLPSNEERKQLVASLDRSLYSVSCDLRARPGKVTARRLNRAEYNHTVRDLFGLDRFKEPIQPAAGFPSDEVGEGFDNNSDVLSMSPLLMEKYLAAAEKIASIVVVDPETFPTMNQQQTADQLLIHGKVAVGKFRGHCVAPETKAWATFSTPIAGQYELVFEGGANEKNSNEVVVIYDADGKLVARKKIGYFGGRAKSARVSVTVNLDAGNHQFFVRLADEQDHHLLVGQSLRPDRVLLTESITSDAKVELLTPRKPQLNINPTEFPLLIRKLTLKGPTKFPAETFPPTQFEIVRKTAEKRGDHWRNVRAAAQQCIKPLVGRAFRRPVDESEVEPYVNLVVDATERGESYHRGIQIAVTAILVSPNFLFRIETPEEDVAERVKSVPSEVAPSESTPLESTPLKSTPLKSTRTVALTQHQLASRLSYFLFSSMPDRKLIDAADRGELAGERLEKEVKRMLRDPKSSSLANQFAAQWLGLRNLKIHEADTEKFPTFSAELTDAMSGETEQLFSHIVSENRPVVELLTADYSFVNPLLARHYGIDIDASTGEQTDQEFVRVSLSDSPRRGVLSHASVLTLTSNPGRTSPVKRGKWILENVLGTPPPDPPPGIPELEQTKTAGENASLREQLELHRADPACAACHRVMDQLGFGLEQFDAVGQFRESDGANRIDSSGELPDGRSFSTGRELSEVLGKTELDAFAKTMVARLMTFSLGRGLSPGDRCVLDDIAESTRGRGYRMQDLIVEVVKSRPFQFYEWTDR